MEYTYSCQKKAEEKRDNIIYIPENTVIKKDCLIGIENEVFVRCFKNLQEIAYSVYNDMINNFADYGIKAETGKDGHFNLVGCFGDVLYQMSLLGELKNGAFAINIEKFKAGAKKHKYNLIINKLRDNGFEITNHNGKTFDKDAEFFEVSYPDMPEVVNTLKGYALIIAKYLADVKPSYVFYMTDFYNFINFQYRFAEDETTRKYSEPVFMTKTDLYSDNGKKTLYWLHDEADRYGYKMNSGFCTVLDFRKGNKLFLCLNEDENKKINSRIILRKTVQKHVDMIYDLPEYLQKEFKVSTCSFCGGSKPKDGSCDMRICYDWHNESIIGCAYHSFKFKDIQYEDLPLLLDLWKTEFNVK